MVAHSRNTNSATNPLLPLHMTLGELQMPRPGSLLRSPLHREVATSAAGTLLDRVHARFLENPEAVDETMEELMSGLRLLKSSMEPEVWHDVLDQCVSHPVREIIHQDPFSARSFNKPRGYAGDAVLIDYIYSASHQLSDHELVSPLGKRIFDFNRDTPACGAVRARRDLVATYIDATCAVIDHPSILSVACGHLREATLCRSVTKGHVGRFVALDQDELSLQTVTREVAEHGVVPVCSSIKSLFRGEIARERFDFVYSTGLYDYLDDRIASRLTARLFQMLNPGGRLLVANFLPDISGAAYMESFMDWKLIYRTPAQLDAIASAIPSSEIAGRRTFTERHDNIVFLELMRD